MEDDNYILISSLAEFIYCNRRYYLRVLEKQHNENIYMIEGIIQHNNVHNHKIEKRHNFVKVSELNVYSHKHNLIGKCDIVEFLENPKGTYIPFLNNKYDIYPIEYKHGKIKDEIEYNIQLCAQVICIEEMYNTHINYGAIYYIDSNERFEVQINDNLRQLTLNTIKEIENINNKQNLILPNYKKRCKKCSLFDICNPQINTINNYINEMWEDKI